MEPPDLQILACPRCRGRLTPTPPAAEGRWPDRLRCDREGLEFLVLDQVPRLVRPDRAESTLAFAQEYSRVWRKDGWGVPDLQYLLALPYRDTTRRASARWKVKARSFDAFLTLVEHLSPRTVADLGCGVGWLSHRLSQRGLEVYAMDVVLDDVLGLGAASAYLGAGGSFHRVWGELSDPPFRDGCFDLVVCNASLHYESDLPGTLGAIGRILRPGGSLVVMNSPVHASPESARRAEADFQAHLRKLGANESVASTYHHFVEANLVSMLEGVVGPTQEIAYDPGIGFRWIRGAKGRLLRMELARFPLFWARHTIVAAEKPGDPSGLPGQREI